MTRIEYTGASPELRARRLDNRDAAEFLTQALPTTSPRDGSWTLHVHEDALFDGAGLRAVTQSIENYRGDAQRLTILLELPFEAWRDYYSLQCDWPAEHAPGIRATIELPMHATRAKAESTRGTVIVQLHWIETPLRFPASLAPASSDATPTALLMRYTCDHDVLFANQILAFAQLAQVLRRSPWTWIKAGLSRLPGSYSKRIAPTFKRIHPSAQVHPTAVIEGSTIGAGSRIGAHCVVRYSRVGNGVQLHDGAKVEYSVVDDHAWLMHDLVLYRCHVEPEVFLIHGPYQFSCFQRASAAFATIMMDYRPDGSPIKVMTPRGLRAYAGRFLGALLEENSKSVGGALLAPGIRVPQGTTVGPPADQVIRPKTLAAFTSASSSASTSPRVPARIVLQTK